MNWLSRIALGSVLAFGLFVVPSPAEAKGHIGSYSRVHSGRGYSYRHFNYFSPHTKKHAHHVAVYHPKHPRHVFFFNPVTKKYWGRYDLKLKGYSMLAEADRKPTIGEIPECAFPAPGKIPPPEPGIEESMLPPPELSAK